MAISQQELHILKIDNLKNLVNFEISFDGSPVTAILGPNGNGKSTILHILACAFQPDFEGEDYKFSSFFLPNTDALWNGSKLEIIHSYRDEQTPYSRITREYKKTEIRWTPRYANRPKRDVFYIGIDKCVPLIESEKKHAKINYSTQSINGDTIEKILSKASFVLNRKYSGFNVHNASGKEFIGVEVDGLKYSALSMSAGEQKVFYILEKVFKAKKNTLILIDELDLLLHDSAMKNLVNVVHEQAIDKKLQIVFTTHRESILELENLVNIRHIVCMPGKSLCFNETKPDAISRLTGKQPKPIEVFVEDDLALTVIRKISAQLQGVKYVSVQRFGAAINCFTTVSGILLSGDICSNSAFVLDGDIYRKQEEKENQIKKIITGNDSQAISYREEALTKIFQFQLPENTSPEKFLHGLIISLQKTGNGEFNEIIEIAKGIVAVNDNHKFIDDIIDRLGWEKNVGLSKIIDLISTTESWDAYIAPIKNWLEPKINAMHETPVNTN